MRLIAYVLVGDPAWTTESVASYYGQVEHILVSYDENNRSWSGGELEVPEALTRLRALDHAHKLIDLPGDYSDPSRPPLDLETVQRQRAIDEATRLGADWVVQLDTDEVLPDPDVFFAAIARADELGRGGVDFPQRWVYQRTHDGRFLERSGRLWTRRSGYPGPAAVRAGSVLSHCRQTDDDLLRIDVAARNTDPARRSAPGKNRVDLRITPDQAIVHLSWVRTPAQMARKTVVSGHAADPDWPTKVRIWQQAYRHPLLTALATPLRRDANMWLRPTSLPIALGSADWMTEG